MISKTNRQVVRLQITKCEDVTSIPKMCFPQSMPDYVINLPQVYVGT